MSLTTRATPLEPKGARQKERVASHLIAYVYGMGPTKTTGLGSGVGTQLTQTLIEESSVLGICLDICQAPRLSLEVCSRGQQPFEATKFNQRACSRSDTPAAEDLYFPRRGVALLIGILPWKDGSACWKDRRCSHGAAKSVASYSVSSSLSQCLRSPSTTAPLTGRAK